MSNISCMAVSGIDMILGFIIKLFVGKFGRSMEAVIIPQKSLKTSLKKKLSNIPKIHFIDVEEAVMNKYKLKDIHSEEFLMKAKEFVEDFKKNFKHKIVILTSKKEIARYVGVSVDKIHYMLPSQNLFNEITKDIENPPLIDEIKKSRELIISHSKGVFKVFSSLDELTKLVVDKFHINLNSLL